MTPDEVKAYYEQNRKEFLTPEKRSFHLLVADEAKIGAGSKSAMPICGQRTTRTSTDIGTPEQRKSPAHPDQDQ